LPTYGYQCTQNKHEFSVFQSMKDDPIASCPECGSPVKRLLYPVGVVFKGSGWYVNDSRKPDASETTAKPAEAKSGETTSSETKTTESTPSESKPAESKTETASKTEAKGS
jgi:putative FmdB family regulatory protein